MIGRQSGADRLPSCEAARPPVGELSKETSGSVGQIILWTVGGCARASRAPRVRVQGGASQYRDSPSVADWRGTGGGARSPPEVRRQSESFAVPALIEPPALEAAGRA